MTEWKSGRELRAGGLHHWRRTARIRKELRRAVDALGPEGATLDRMWQAVAARLEHQVKAEPAPVVPGLPELPASVTAATISLGILAGVAKLLVLPFFPLPGLAVLAARTWRATYRRDVAVPPAEELVALLLPRPVAWGLRLALRYFA